MLAASLPVGARQEECEMELPGEGVVFVRVKAGELEKAVKEVRGMEGVTRAEPVLGPYDLVVTGAFRDAAGLQRFLQQLQEKGFSEGYEAKLSLEHWKRDRDEKGLISAWTLIEATNPERVMKELQRIPAVNRLYTTLGHYNVIANIAAPETPELLKILERDFHGIREIRRTETMPGVRDER